MRLSHRFRFDGGTDGDGPQDRDRVPQGLTCTLWFRLLGRIL